MLDQPPGAGHETNDALSDDVAEMALLGAILHDNRVYGRVVDILRAEHFASRVHSRIFDAVATLIDQRRIADPITLKGLFDTDRDLASVGGYTYLMRLAGSVASIGSAHDYARRIVTLAHLRDLMALSDDMRRFAVEPEISDDYEVDINKAALQFETRLSSIASAEVSERGTVTLAAASIDAIAGIRDARTRGDLVGIGTGISDLDRILGGWHSPDLVVVGGRPKMGKTAFLTTAARAAVLAGHPTVLFSMEMSAPQLAQRILAEMTGISTERQRLGRVSDEEFEHLERAAADLDRLPLYIDDTPGLSLAALRSRARRLARRVGIKLIGVDYLQLMAGDADRRGENRVQELTHITKGLKGLAKELGVPLLALSQLSRAVESRDDKRPTPSDLRDSGSIEQDADIVMFTYREEEYLRRQEPHQKTGEGREAFYGRMADWKDQMARAEGVGEVLIEMNRHGSPARLECRFDGVRSSWGNLARLV